MDIITINDNPPDFLIQGGMECVAEKNSRRRRRRDVDEEKELGADKRMVTFSQKQKVCIN